MPCVTWILSDLNPREKLKPTKAGLILVSWYEDGNQSSSKVQSNPTLGAARRKSRANSAANSLKHRCDMLMVAQRSKVKAAALWSEPVSWYVCAGILAPDEPLRAAPPVLHQRSMRQTFARPEHWSESQTPLWCAPNMACKKGNPALWSVAWHCPEIPVCVCVCHPRVIKTDVNTERGLEKWRNVLNICSIICVHCFTRRTRAPVNRSWSV